MAGENGVWPRCGATITRETDVGGAQDGLELAEALGPLEAGGRIAEIGRRFGDRAIATTSAGAQAPVMLHLIARHAPEIPVVFIDTGFHFPETYVYLERLREAIDVKVEIYAPTLTAARLEAVHGRLWEGDEAALARYSLLTKVEPMDRALRDHRAAAWISGLRRAHSKERARRELVDRQGQTLKLYPILDWTDEDVAGYMLAHDLPAHPLLERGYVSIGDWHSTRPLEDGMTPEETRFNGIRRECGLHIDSQVSDYRI
ncbi:MAG: phosphoadenylyl-sulfate reductase [Thermoleophilia bacterium]|nr:phosphoadenylyl-sulfate reductase [Thermoleophilia bacterium]MDH3724252.1 phosphoadenylyl-sulfate reductase [Thermoleophilia bacterium]